MLNKRTFFITGLAAVLMACAPSDTAKKDTAPDITISNASVRGPAPGQSVAAAFFTITNTGGADTLLSVSTPQGSSSELHTHLHEDGIMKMRRVETVAIDSGVTEFKSGGAHVMIFGADVPDNAATVPLTLNFEKAGVISVDLKTGHAKPAMDHSGH